MRGMKRILGGLAVAGMMLATSVQVGAVGAVSSRGLASGADGACRVSISRNATAGIFKVTREVFSNGSCRCSVSAGPASQGGSAEAAIAALRTSRNCSKANLGLPPGGVTPGLGTGGLIGGSVIPGGGLGAGLGGSGPITTSP